MPLQKQQQKAILQETEFGKRISTIDNQREGHYIRPCGTLFKTIQLSKIQLDLVKGQDPTVWAACGSPTVLINTFM